MVLIQRLGRGVGTLIGLGQEAYAHHQDKKQAITAELQDERLDREGSEREHTHSMNFSRSALAEQDVLGNERGPPPCQGRDNSYALEPRLQQPEPRVSPGGNLPAPVLIPQRRPNDKTRGFVAAYAPALEACDIPQAAFLEFLDGFVRKTQGPRMAVNVLNLSVALGLLSHTLAVGGMVSPTLHLAATAVHMSLETGKRLYVNRKMNGYLERMNEELFQPRGLFALVMTYDPESGEASETWDFDAQTAVAVHHADSQSWMQKFKGPSTEVLPTYLPEVCSLVFPQTTGAGGTEMSSDGRLRRTLAFTQDYFDRRAQAKFAANNVESKLNVQEHEFAGRYADPTTFEHSGLIGVATGGLLDPCKQRWQQQRSADAESNSSHARGGMLCKLRDNLQEKVLYLLIVNMPSADELEGARILIENARAPK